MAGAAGAGGGGPFEPLPLRTNGNFGDDVGLHFLDLPSIDGGTIPAPPPPAMHDANQPAGGRVLSSFGDDDLLDWVASTASTTFGPNAAAAPLPHSGLRPVYGGWSTASTSSPAVPQEAALDCSGCQILRDITHSNGFEATRLCIHGGAGVFYHARQDEYRLNPEGLDTLTHQAFVDFRGQDYELVKHYLTNYALQRAIGNYILVNDSLSVFHDVLCTPMNCVGAHTGRAAEEEARNGGDDHLVVDAAAFQPTMIEGYVVHADKSEGPSQQNHTVQMQQPSQRPVAKTALAMQRARTANLQLQDIARYFDIPMAEAAVKLGICSTALKGVCRKHNVSRWPYRKLKSIGGKITNLGRFNNAAARNEIEMLNASRRRILAGQ